MKKNRITFYELIKVEKALNTLSYPLYVERGRKGPVVVRDSEGNFIQLMSYSQLPVLLMFIERNSLGRGGLNVESSNVESLVEENSSAEAERSVDASEVLA